MPIENSRRLNTPTFTKKKHDYNEDFAYDKKFKGDFHQCCVAVAGAARSCIILGEPELEP
jgi:hypothetical protein